MRHWKSPYTYQLSHIPINVREVFTNPNIKRIYLTFNKVLKFFQLLFTDTHLRNSGKILTKLCHCHRWQELIPTFQGALFTQKILKQTNIQNIHVRSKLSFGLEAVSKLLADMPR